MFNDKNYFFEGNCNLLNREKYFFISIVGSRNILPYTEMVLDCLFEELNNFKNIVIVSGGMYGVDLYSHNLALRYGLGTILFLPCGIEIFKNSYLYKSLKFSNQAKLLLISKFSADVSPRKYAYLERNRQIIDISNVVLVAQSGEKSGSMYSGHYALKSSKKTFAIPISLNNKQFLGNNYLISHGARVYITPRDFLDECVPSFKNNLSLNDFLMYFPCTKEQLILNFPDYDISMFEKILLEGILKGEIFYQDKLIYRKND